MINKKAKLAKKIFEKDIEMVATRQGYGEGLVIAGEKDERVVVLCADLTESTRSILFQEKFPERFIEVRVAERRGRKMLLAPDIGLRRLGVDAAEVRDVIITHLHYDHVGNFDLFPAATFHVQDLEMHYATGRHMAQPVFGGAFEVELAPEAQPDPAEVLVCVVGEVLRRIDPPPDARPAA